LDLDLSSYVVHGAKFETPKRYTLNEPVGQGAYGVVCSAQDEEKGETVAIKKIENAFEHLTFAKRTLRELRILRHLQHENLIDIRHVFLPGVKESFEDIYCVSELMETDLASILKSPQPISDDHCQFFLYQILRGLKYVHSAQVIHRDLKPRNILVNSNCDLKICDYGLARVHYDESREDEFHVSPMTEYVCTRWYRAPEVLCSWTDYGKAIDIWSVGCIFAEMLQRKPLFPGKNTQHQLQLIISCLGSPERETLKRIPNDKCKKFIESLPATGGRSLEEAANNASRDALDVLNRTLRFNPDRRVTVEQSLEHPYVSQLHCPEDEPVCEPLPKADFEFERRKIDIVALREELFLEALRYHPQKRAQYLEEQKRSGIDYSITNCRLLAPGESQYTSDDDEEGSV
jgi:mitogen-activated protein kinase 1/3/mitogen-activated protein kinase 6